MKTGQKVNKATTPRLSTDIALAQHSEYFWMNKNKYLFFS